MSAREDHKAEPPPPAYEPRNSSNTKQTPTEANPNTDNQTTTTTTQTPYPTPPPPKGLPPTYPKSTHPHNRPAAPSSTPEPTVQVGNPASRLASLMPPQPPPQPRERSWRKRVKSFWRGDDEPPEWKRFDTGSRAEANWLGVGLGQYGGPFGGKGGR